MWVFVIHQILFAFGLYGFIAYSFFAFIVPYEPWPAWQRPLLSLVGIFLLANIIYNYLGAIFTGQSITHNIICDRQRRTRPTGCLLASRVCVCV